MLLGFSSHHLDADVYKPKLEEILNDIIVITEIAELGAEADNLPDDAGTQMNAKQLVDDNLKKRGRLTEVRWSSVKFHSRARADSDASSVLERTDTSSVGDASPVPGIARKMDDTPTRSFMARTSNMSFRSSGHIRIKNLLDRWDEPVNKLDKVRTNFESQLKSAISEANKFLIKIYTDY